jgi:putative transposase
MEANDVKRSKELEDKNAKLKKMFAEVSLKNHVMKGCRPISLPRSIN